VIRAIKYLLSISSQRKNFKKMLKEGNKEEIRLYPLKRGVNPHSILFLDSLSISEQLNL
jgi:hypothetical protein